MYLRVSSNGATTSSTSYSLTNAAPAKPYLQIQTGTTKWYLPLTTATVAGTRLSIKSGTSTYRPLVYSTYKTTSTAVGNMSSTTALTKESSVYYNTTTLTAIPNKTAITNNMYSYMLVSYVYSMTNASYTNYQFYRELQDYDHFAVRDGLGMSDNNIPGGYAHLSFSNNGVTAEAYKGSTYKNTSFVKYANGFTYSSEMTLSTFPVGSLVEISNATFQASTTINKTAVPWVSFSLTRISLTTLKTASQTYTGPVAYSTITGGGYYTTSLSDETKTMTLYSMTGYTNAQNLGGTYTSTASIYTNSANTSGKAGVKYTMTGRYRKDYLIKMLTLMSSANTQTFSTSKTTTAYSGVSSKWA